MPDPIRLGVISFAHGHVIAIARSSPITMMPMWSPPGMLTTSAVKRTPPSSA